MFTYFIKHFYYVYLFILPVDKCLTHQHNQFTQLQRTFHENLLIKQNNNICKVTSSILLKPLRICASSCMFYQECVACSDQLHVFLDQPYPPVSPPGSSLRQTPASPAASQFQQVIKRFICSAVQLMGCSTCVSNRGQQLTTRNKNSVAETTSGYNLLQYSSNFDTVYISVIIVLII